MMTKVDVYFSKPHKWQEEMEKLREILLDCGLNEELKWGKPCYTCQSKTVVVIQGFKEYCAVLFFKGILLSDPKGVLTKTGENTHVGRQIRFTKVREIGKIESVLKAYIYEAIEVERAGLKVPSKEKQELVIPDEFKKQLLKNKKLKLAFEALTPGRQKAYILYFSAPKQSKTKETRIDKCIPQILNGMGLNDR